MITRRKILKSLLATALTSPTSLTALATERLPRAGLPNIGVHLPLWHQGQIEPEAFWSEVFEQLAAHSISQCSILSYYFVDPRTGQISNSSKFNNIRSPDIGFVEHGLKIARKFKIRPTIYPMLEIDNPHQIGDIWRGNLNFFGTTLTSFFTQYSALIMSHCELAQTYDSPYLYIGSELASLTHNIAARPFWEQMLYNLQSKGQHGSAKLVYAAHWEEYLTFPFWRQLDEIGINAYFPLATIAQADGIGKPAYEAIEKLLLDKFTDLEAFAKLHQRPWQISEFGLTGFDLSTVTPWLQSPSIVPDPFEQEGGYRALFNAMGAGGRSERHHENMWLSSATLWHWKLPERNGSAYNIEPHSPVANMIKAFQQT